MAEKTFKAEVRPHRFVIYLPSVRSDGGEVPGVTNLIVAAEALLCGRLGGVTSYPAVGAFKRQNGEIQREHIQVLESFCDEKTWGLEGEFLFGLAEVLARELRQESVACSLDGEMALATPAPGSVPQLADVAGCSPEQLERLVMVRTGS